MQNCACSRDDRLAITAGVVFWKRLLALAFSFAGISVIYLTLVRTNLLVLAGMIAVFAFLQQFTQSKSRMISVVALAIGVGFAGYILAERFGGLARFGLDGAFLSLLEQHAVFFFRHMPLGSIPDDVNRAFLLAPLFGKR